MTKADVYIDVFYRLYDAVERKSGATCAVDCTEKLLEVSLAVFYTMEDKTE